METTTTDRDRETEREILTHPLELLLEVGHVLALGDPEVVVRVVRLVHAVGGRRRPDRQHGGRTGGALRLPHLLHGHSRAGHRLRPLFLSTLYHRLQQVDRSAASYSDSSSTSTGRSPAGFPDRRSERASCDSERALWMDDRRQEG